MGNTEKLIATGAVLALGIGGIALAGNTLKAQDDSLLHDGREAAIATVDRVLNEEVTLKPGVVIHFGPKRVGGAEQDQDAYKVQNGTVVEAYRPLVSDEYPGKIIVQIPGQEGDIAKRLGWVNLNDANGKPRTDIVIKQLKGLPESQPVSYDQQGHIAEIGRGVIPDPQVALTEIKYTRE